MIAHRIQLALELIRLMRMELVWFPIGSSDVTDPDNSYPLASYTVTYTNASLATVTFDPAVGDLILLQNCIKMEP